MDINKIITVMKKDKNPYPNYSNEFNHQPEIISSSPTPSNNQ
jgi:hypothetical protein